MIKDLPVFIHSHNSKAKDVPARNSQVYLAAGTAPGRFLLAAARAQLGGRALPATRQAVMTFDMHQVSRRVTAGRISKP